MISIWVHFSICCFFKKDDKEEGSEEEKVLVMMRMRRQKPHLVGPKYKQMPTWTDQFIQIQLKQSETMCLHTWLSLCLSRRAPRAVLTRICTVRRKSCYSDTTASGSYDEALKCIQSELSPLKCLHCCINDCIVFRDEYTDVTICPICEAPRFDEDGSARRGVCYMPIGPRLF